MKGLAQLIIGVVILFWLGNHYFPPDAARVQDRPCTSVEVCDSYGEQVQQELDQP